MWSFITYDSDDNFTTRWFALRQLVPTRWSFFEYIILYHIISYYILVSFQVFKLVSTRWSWSKAWRALLMPGLLWCVVVIFIIMAITIIIIIMIRLVWTKQWSTWQWSQSWSMWSRGCSDVRGSSTPRPSLTCRWWQRWIWCFWICWWRWLRWWWHDNPHGSHSEGHRPREHWAQRHCRLPWKVSHTIQPPVEDNIFHVHSTWTMNMSHLFTFSVQTDADQKRKTYIYLSRCRTSGMSWSKYHSYDTISKYVHTHACNCLIPLLFSSDLLIVWGKPITMSRFIT